MNSSIPPPSAGFQEVFRNAYIVLRYDVARKLVVLNRLQKPYSSLEDLRATFEGMEQGIAYVHRHRTSILVDSRRSPARNDAEFEAEFARLRRKFITEFRKVAILVQTAVGVLQINRLARTDEMALGAFTDPGEALAYLGVYMDPGRLDMHD